MPKKFVVIYVPPSSVKNQNFTLNILNTKFILFSVLFFLGSVPCLLNSALSLLIKSELLGILDLSSSPNATRTLDSFPPLIAVLSSPCLYAIVTTYITNHVSPRARMSKRNIMQATFIIFKILVATLNKLYGYR